MKVKKILICILLILVLIVTCIPHNVYAEDEDLIQKIKNQGTSWLDKGKTLGSGVLPSDDLQNKFVPIGQVLVMIATMVVLVVTLIMGIKYITANPEEKGKLKQHLL